MIPISVIGAGLCFDDLTRKHLQIIGEADVLAGGKRHLSWFESHPGIKVEIASPLSKAISEIRTLSEEKKVAVLASGDPLFFGIGRTLVDAFGKDNVDLFPNVGAMAACFSRIKTSWQDASVVSLHGKDRAGELKRCLREKDTIFVFTDPVRNPAWIGRFATESGAGDWRMCVFEQLGTIEERVRWISPAEASALDFKEPNAVVLKKENTETKKRPLALGAPDHWYAHERGMITKSEIRAVALSKLRLCPDHVFWDLGAGSGSVSIEASIFITRGQIVAVEKNDSRIERIRENIEIFGTENIRVVKAELPEGTEELPPPHRVFIGGGGRDLPEIIRAAAKKLLPQGRIVVNTVMIETMAAATAELKSLGFETETIQAQINESVPMPSGTRFEAKNPVWMVSGGWC